MSRFWFYTIFIIALVGCKYYPQDTRGATKHIQNTKVIRVGVVENAPWAYKEAGKVKGIDVDIIKEFSKTLNVTPTWFFMSEYRATNELKKYQLDIIIGGLTDDNPYKMNIAFTRPYIQLGEHDKNRYVMGVAKGQNQLIILLEKHLKQQQSVIVNLYVGAAAP